MICCSNQEIIEYTMLYLFMSALYHNMDVPTEKRKRLFHCPLSCLSLRVNHHQPKIQKIVKKSEVVVQFAT